LTILLSHVLFAKKYIYILAVKTASPGNRHCANYIGTLLFPIGSGSYWAERPVHLSTPWAASISGPPSAILNTTHYSVHQCSFTQPLRFNFHWHQNAKCAMGQYTLPALTGSRPVFTARQHRCTISLPCTFEIAVGRLRFLTKPTVWPAHFSDASATHLHRNTHAVPCSQCA